MLTVSVRVCERAVLTVCVRVRVRACAGARVVAVHVDQQLAADLYLQQQLEGGDPAFPQEFVFVGGQLQIPSSNSSVVDAFLEEEVRVVTVSQGVRARRDAES